MPEPVKIAFRSFLDIKDPRTYAACDESLLLKASHSTPLIHPLLLSLCATFNEANPNISTISENDGRVLLESDYTEPGTFPPLEIHFLGKNGLYVLSNQNCYSLTEPHTSSQLPRMHAVLQYLQVLTVSEHRSRGSFLIQTCLVRLISPAVGRK